MEFRSLYLSGVSHCSSDASQMLSEHFDVMVIAPSWDTRCRCITQACGLSVKEAVVVLLPAKDSGGLRDRHEREIRTFIERTGGNTHLVGHDERPGTDVRTLWLQLRTCLFETRVEAKRPLSILLDISTCPRYLSLAVLGLCLGTGLAQRVSMFYAEGVYPPAPSGGAERHEFFTQGRWNTIAVPGFTGRWDPWKDRMYFVSIGFEGAKTLRVISAADPDRLVVLLPDPGSHPDYPARTRRNNRALFEQYNLHSTRRVKAPSGDAIATWKVLSERQLERPDEENVFYLCCGTKPHAIALALRAKLCEYPAVLYNLPESHNVIAIQPNDVYWRYDVEDLSCIVP